MLRRYTDCLTMSDRVQLGKGNSQQRQREDTVQILDPQFLSLLRCGAGVALSHLFLIYNTNSRIVRSVPSSALLCSERRTLTAMRESLMVRLKSDLEIYYNRGGEQKIKKEIKKPLIHINSW